MKSNTYRSRRAEEASAHKLGGRRQPASGALWGSPGDIITDTEVIEHKRTDKAQITLKAAWLVKVMQEAIRKGRRPVLQFELAGEDYFCIPSADYHEIRGRLKECKCGGRTG